MNGAREARKTRKWVRAAATHLERRGEEVEGRHAARGLDRRHAEYLGGAQTALAGSHMMRTCERLDANERRRERPCARGGARLAARACASRRGWLGAPWHCARARGKAHIGVEATRESRPVASGSVRSDREVRRAEARAKRGAATHCPIDRMPTLAKRMPFSRASSVQKSARKLQIDLQR